MAKGKKRERDETFGVPMFEGGAHIELFSDREACLDGIRGVLEYSDCFIKLNTGRGTVGFWGNDLKICSLTAAGLSIAGKFDKIEFNV